MSQITSQILLLTHSREIHSQIVQLLTNT
ncbi:hypothetical protein E2C01_084782 [Portunus trituberculatus]|uniref:Uncharacterized protein n=1 Tax=Portunus trituberculatus TaxID=210409 RepID=A0A5B7J0W8_PORTR|nr:hypothetical protein [Portunus trituberculatus]